MNSERKPAESSKTITRPEILAQLKREHETLGHAILAVERLIQGGGKRRGRPPGSKNKAA